MSRASTTSDVFNAIAEPRRREIIQLLARTSPQTVGELVTALRLGQPAVSKHLRVLRMVGIVSVEHQGKCRFYALNPKTLKPVHDWVQQYEHFWSRQLSRIKQRAELKSRHRATQN